MAEWTPLAEKYLKKAKKIHRQGKVWPGKNKNVKWIKRLIDEYNCRTMLDYGCGRADQYRRPIPKMGGMTREEYFGIPVTLYDPAVPEYWDKPPGTFDIVTCIYVMEHVHESGREWVVEDLYGYADKVLFVDCGLPPSWKQKFPGEEHKTEEYWRALFEKPRRCELIMAFH